MEPEEAKRIRDAVAVAQRGAFDSGVAWSICSAAWGFFLSAFALALFGEFDRPDPGHWKGALAIAIVTAAV